MLSIFNKKEGCETDGAMEQGIFGAAPIKYRVKEGEKRDTPRGCEKVVSVFLLFLCNKVHCIGFIFLFSHGKINGIFFVSY